MPINWFDVFVLLMLFIGYVRGRKNGMSQEMLPMLKWIFLIGACSVAYEPLGSLIASTLKVGKLFSYIFAYVLVGTVITLVFLALSRSLGEKLKGSDMFGKGEFYLAMPAGVVRFACITLALLALLNARHYSTAEVKAMQKFQNENYGSNFFPTLSSLQDDVFLHSFLGKQIKDHLDFLLIKPTPPVNPSVPAMARERREAGF
mgnify:CR=1 FL=1